MPALQQQPGFIVLFFCGAVIHGDITTSERRETPHLNISMDLSLASPALGSEYSRQCQTVVFQGPASGSLSTLSLVYAWSSFGTGIQTLFFLAVSILA